MKKRYVVFAFVVVAMLLHSLHQNVIETQHDLALRICIAKLKRMRVEAAKIPTVPLRPFQQGYQQLGYRNQKGQIVIQPQFAEARRFSQGRAVVADRNWYKGFIDPSGRVVISQQFIWVSDFIDGLAVFDGTRKDREKKGFIDLNGNIVLEFRDVHLDEFSGFKNGRTRVFIYEADTPLGFLVPPGNPIPKIFGYLDCTGKVVLAK